MTENTLRDHFAMAALTGLLSATSGSQMANDVKRGENPITLNARAAYAFADAMLAERQKPKANEGAEK